MPSKENLLRQKRLVIPSILALLVLWSLPAVSRAQNPSTYTVGLAAGIGGSTDAEPDTEYDDFGFQLLFALETDVQTEFVVRLGQMDFDAKDDPAGQFDTELTYLTLAGEYKFAASFYESGLFLGLGLYDLSGDGVVEDDSGLGATVGATGNFRLTDRLSFILEFSGHYADVDYAQIFIMGHAGVAYHF